MSEPRAIGVHEQIRLLYEMMEHEILVEAKTNAERHQEMLSAFETTPLITRTVKIKEKPYRKSSRKARNKFYGW